jgi:hypothetical protein
VAVAAHEAAVLLVRRDVGVAQARAARAAVAEEQAVDAAALADAMAVRVARVTERDATADEAKVAVKAEASSSRT